MMDMPYLSLLIALPLVGAVLLGVVPVRGRIREVALLVTLVELALALATLMAVDPNSHAFQLQEELPWIPDLNIHYRVGVDGLSALFLPFTALLFAGVIVASPVIQILPRLHFSMLLFLEGATIGVFTALDTMLFFLFWELTLAPVYFLVSLWGIGPRRREAATKYTLLMLVGGVPLLFGFLMAALAHVEPLFDLPSLLAHPLPPSLQTMVFLLLLVGFGVKTPVLPFHTWLPSVAMQGPTGVVAVMTGLKLGAYGLLRFAIPMAPEAARSFHWLLAGLGVTGIVYGVLVALAQTNLRRLLAYSSISHVGLVVLGLASFSLQGVQGAVFQLLNFTLVAGGLFCLAGFLQHRFGSTDLIHLGGLARPMPKAAIFFLLLGLGGLGMPLTSGFPAELLLLQGALSSHMGAGLAALGGGIISAAYFLGFYRQAFLGPLRHPYLSRGPDLLPREFLVLGVLGILLLVGGFFPRLILGFTRMAAEGWIQRLTTP
ncbi:NADH dehydrogenase subunit M [Gammaproteobacteria bacterium]